MTPIAHELLACKYCGVLWGSLEDEIPSACPRCDKENWIRTGYDLRSNWADATALDDDETLWLVIVTVRDFYELHGRWPSATDLRAELRR